MSQRVCVLNEGVSEPAADTTELFAHPRTLQSALITGCKNCVPASLTQTGQLLVPSWNAVLACESAEQSSITHAGIRAHLLLLLFSIMPQNTLKTTTISSLKD